MGTISMNILMKLIFLSQARETDLSLHPKAKKHLKKKLSI